MKQHYKESFHVIPQSTGSSWQFAVSWETFVKMVLDLTVEACQAMSADQIGKPDWHEDVFSLRLADDYMRPIAFDHSMPLHVAAQSHVITDDIKSGVINPNSAKRIDVRLNGSWERDYNSIYFAWEFKKVGEKEGTSRYNKHVLEYITEGIKRYIDGDYSSRVSDSGMIGIVLSHTPEKIVSDINHKMKSTPGLATFLSDTDELTPVDVVSGFSDIYMSAHSRHASSSNIRIFHLFVSFF